MLRLKVLSTVTDNLTTYYWLILRERPGALPEEVEESKSTYLNRLRCEHAGEKRLEELSQ